MAEQAKAPAARSVVGSRSGGRIETRKCTVIHDVAWLQERHEWPGLRGVVIIDSTREIDTKVSRETRFYITSCALVAEQIAAIIRSHWAIENSLHWTMDMVFRDDECRVRDRKSVV